MFSRFISVVACVRIPYLFKAEYYSVAYVHHILFIHSSTDGHLACFHLLTIVDNTALNIGVQVSVRVPALNSFGFIPSSKIAGSYGNSVLLFGGPPNCLP